ncbi:uncharacterized protein F4822DRAFT_444963 [Hypoxylon trugodes]|uniref:uncharacterized protein n=1 Tax=Hypoxylon trugodes TaxID=326681 RepID=UPI002195BC24|nr:uncharacterized protein F4822DRAFT_444963 [Hypoxylon trugodes]KAI1386621.1 hypothetical protein F4822DRAFT_444963 [Hypoxylon trugodes]
MISPASTIATTAAILAVISQGSCQTSRTINLSPTAPSDVSQNVDPSFPGFAFEQASFYAYSFNAQGNPNIFSRNLVDSVLNRTGGIPIIRVGGTSGDHGTYNASQKEPTNFPATKFGPQMRGGVTIGPSFFDAFKNWPGAKFEFMVPFRNASYSHSIEWAKAGMSKIGIDNLFTLEIGNEPNFYGWFQDPNGRVPGYVKRYTNLHDKLQDALPALNGKKIFQTLDTAANHPTVLTAKEAFEKGLNDIAPSIKQVAFHYYQGHGPKTFHELQDWVRHSGTVKNMSAFIPNIKYLQANHPKIDFAFTETGYNVGGGGGSIDSNLATALWAVDFQLYCMTVNVRRVNWQQILMASLSMWRAVESKRGDPIVSANYYSQPFIADFIGKGGKTQVSQLNLGDDRDGTLVAYGAYESGKLARIAFLNLDMWTTRNGTRPQVDFVLKGLSATGTQAKIHRLSAPDGALAKNNLSYAGLEWTWESRGIGQQLRDDSTVMDINSTNMTVSVDATSAVMVVL